MQTLLEMFPYFLDKNETSNFFKSQSVSNAQFQGIWNSLMEVYESFHLQKRCLIWKGQYEPYQYTINFVINFPNLKSINLYKNDELIYSEYFNYEDKVHNFIYSYEGNSLNDILSPQIIPNDTFIADIALIVVTRAIVGII